MWQLCLFEVVACLSDDLAVGKDVYAVFASGEGLVDVPVEADGLFLSGVFDVFAYGVGELLVFEVEAAAFAEGLACGGGDAEVEGTHTSGGGDVARDGEVDGDFLDVFDFLAFLASLVEGDDADGGGVELAGDGDFVAELLVLVGEIADVGLGLLIFLAQVGVVNFEGFVFAAEGVYLYDVVAEDLSQGGEFFLEAHDFSCVIGFGALEFLEK